MSSVNVAREQGLMSSFISKSDRHEMHANRVMKRERLRPKERNALDLSMEKVNDVNFMNVSSG